MRSSRISPLIAFRPPGTPGRATNSGAGSGLLTLQVPVNCTYQKSVSSVTEAIEARTPVLSRTLSNRRLPATRTPAQCMPNSLFFVGNPLKTPGIVGTLPVVVGVPAGIGTV